MRRGVTITGGSGFLGRLLRRAFKEQGIEVDVFDLYRGPVVDKLRLAPLQRGLRAAGLIKPSGDDILGEREALARRFRGATAVVHLAGIPHPHTPGATEDDFVRVNYDGAPNVFEAARDAGVPLFVFASSAQVYRINDPVRLDQLPVLESNYLPLPAEGQSAYGFLKAGFERYLDGACAAGATQAVSLRLEFPGARSRFPWNLYVSTSLGNLITGFRAALDPPDDLGFEAFNLADAQVDRKVVDIQQFIRAR
jgi:nucleoside-diphosphate-sugar epimerase